MLSIYGSQPSGGQGNANWNFPLELSGVVDSFDASLASSLDISDTDKVDAWRSKKSGYRLRPYVVEGEERRPSFSASPDAVYFSPLIAGEVTSDRPLSGFIGAEGDEEDPLTSSTRAVIFVVTTGDIANVSQTDVICGNIVVGGEYLGLNGFAGETVSGFINAGAKTIAHVGVDASYEAGAAAVGFVPYPSDDGPRLVYLETSAGIEMNTLGPTGSTGNIYSLHEIIICDAVPSETVRQKLEGYLAWKWGIEDNLPADHPYKAAAPTS